jgi:hypothetical protein
MTQSKRAALAHEERPLNLSRPAPTGRNLKISLLVDNKHSDSESQAVAAERGDGCAQP